MNNEFNIIYYFGREKVSKIPFFDSAGDFMHFETQVAVLSHYLKLEGTLIECSHKEMAPKIIDNWSKLLDDWH